MFRPSELAIKQLFKMCARGVLKSELIHKAEKAGFTDLYYTVSSDYLDQLQDGLIGSDYEKDNAGLWVCTDHSTCIPKLMPLCLIGEELIDHVGLS